MSLTSERLGVWQSIERALGYGASVLEGGLDFLQFFWDGNRMCTQDRLAETNRGRCAAARTEQYEIGCLK